MSPEILIWVYSRSAACKKKKKKTSVSIWGVIEITQMFNVSDKLFHLEFARLALFPRVWCTFLLQMVGNKDTPQVAIHPHRETCPPRHSKDPLDRQRPNGAVVMSWKLNHNACTAQVRVSISPLMCVLFSLVGTLFHTTLLWGARLCVSFLVSPPQEAN